MLGELPGRPGLMLAAGFSGMGLKIFLAVGEAVAALVTGHPVAGTWTLPRSARAGSPGTGRVAPAPVLGRLRRRGRGRYEQDMPGEVGAPGAHGDEYVEYILRGGRRRRRGRGWGVWQGTRWQGTVAWQGTAAWQVTVRGRGRRRAPGAEPAGRAIPARPSSTANGTGRWCQLVLRRAGRQPHRARPRPTADVCGGERPRGPYRRRRPRGFCNLCRHRGSWPAPRPGEMSCGLPAVAAIQAGLPVAARSTAGLPVAALIDSVACAPPPC